MFVIKKKLDLFVEDLLWNLSIEDGIRGTRRGDFLKPPWTGLHYPRIYWKEQIGLPTTNFSCPAKEFCSKENKTILLNKKKLKTVGRGNPLSRNTLFDR